MLMKQKLLLLLGAMLAVLSVQAAAPNSYVKFSVNGKTLTCGFNKFSAAVPEPFDLGMVYRSPDQDKPELSIKGYQVVILTDREGFENEDTHYMLVNIGVYDKSISQSGAYYDRNDKALFVLPQDSNSPVQFGHQFTGGSGALEPMNEVMSANQFVWSDGTRDESVLPRPLVYDEESGTYKEGQYQKGHTYVFAIHFTEMAHTTVGGVDGGTNPWSYPENSGSEYSNYKWTDHSKECLLASFTYAGDEASTTTHVAMKVNGQINGYDLLGSNQEPIELGTIYPTEITLTSTGEKMTVPDLGFWGYIFESAVPYTYSAAAHTYGGSMTFVTMKKSDADQYIVDGLEVDNRDYKTGNFGRINSSPVDAVLCAAEGGLIPLSENWAYDIYQTDVWVNWMYSGTYPVNVSWGFYDEQQLGVHKLEDGETYTVAFYFSEYNGIAQPVYIHRNGGKYYKFNFTYSANDPSGIEAIDNGLSTNDKMYYDLQGRRVTQPSKGVYIVNGKKTIIK